MRDVRARDANAADESAVGAALVDQDEVGALGAERGVPVAHAERSGSRTSQLGASAYDDSRRPVERVSRVSPSAAERTMTVMGMGGSPGRDAAQRRAVRSTRAARSRR